MTLSRFLRDYIYIPLGGNRNGKLRTYQNLMITFLLGGLWHGAGWTFIFWGFLHGAALVIHRIWNSLGLKLNRIIAWIITFNFINITWVFFRAKEWNDAIKVLKGMVGGYGLALPELLEDKLIFIKQYGIKFGGVFNNIKGGDPFAWILGAFIVVLLFKNSVENLGKFKVRFLYIFYTTLMLLSIIMINKKSEFLYFNF